MIGTIPNYDTSDPVERSVAQDPDYPYPADDDHLAFDLYPDEEYPHG